MKAVLCSLLLLVTVSVDAGTWSNQNCTGLNTRDDCGHGSCEIYDTIDDTTVQLMCKCDNAYIDRNGVCNYRQKLLASSFLYSFFLGGFGGDYFYLARGSSKYIVLGVFKALTLGGLAVWQVVDFIRLMTGNMKDGLGENIYDDMKNN